MKKFLIPIIALIAVGVIAATYEADTFGQIDQANSGLVIAEYFTYATGTTEHTTNDTVILAFIPQNARIIGGVIAVSAMGGAQTFDVGLRGADGSGYYIETTANDVDLFLDGISCSNAVVDTFAQLGQGDSNADFRVGSRPVFLTVTCPAAWTTNETITGWVQYIQP